MAGKTRIDFDVLATDRELAQLAKACDTYRRGWEWGFAQQTLGLVDDDWRAYRAVAPKGTPYDDVLYRGVRTGWQSGWCALNRKGAQHYPPRDVARCSGAQVKVDGSEVLAFDAMFDTEPELPAGFKVSSLRVQRTADGWRGSAMGAVKSARKRRARQTAGR